MRVKALSGMCYSEAERKERGYLKDGCTCLLHRSGKEGERLKKRLERGEPPRLKTWDVTSLG